MPSRATAKFVSGHLIYVGGKFFRGNFLASGIGGSDAQDPKLICNTSHFRDWTSESKDVQLSFLWQILNCLFTCDLESEIEKPNGRLERAKEQKLRLARKRKRPKRWPNVLIRPSGGEGYIYDVRINFGVLDPPPSSAFHATYQQYLSAKSGHFQTTPPSVRTSYK